MVSSSVSVGPSLKVSQLSAVHRMLALNSDAPDARSGMSSVDSAPSSSSVLPHHPAGSGHNQWKIFIYDGACRSIISPLMSVADLRSRGVTLHLLLTAEREPIPDVPAVYFVSPTKEAVSIIARDCAKGLYGSAHVNFVSRVSRELMEELAGMVVQTGSLERIASVHDQHLDYVCLESRLFSLHRTNSYVACNGPGCANEADAERLTSDIARGLFSVVATVGVTPVIRCPRGGLPEAVARKLNQMIVDHPTLLNSSSTGGASLSSHHHRPLLVLLDRNEDLVTPVQHNSTYQALIDDVLHHSANRVEFTIKDKNDPQNTRRSHKPPETKKYDLDADADPFYSAHKFSPFPEAIESNGRELQAVTQREMEVKSRAASSGAGATAMEDPMSSDGLASAVESLPALLKHKKQLEIHTAVLQAVMDQVAQRDIPTFYDLESSLVSGSYASDVPRAKKDVIELIKDRTKGNIQDKIRLLAVFCLSMKDAPSSVMDEIVQLLRDELNKELQGPPPPPGAPPPPPPRPGMPPYGAGPEAAAKLAELEDGICAIQYLKRLRSVQIMPSFEKSDKDGGDAASSLGGGAGGGGDSASAPSSGAGGDMLSSFMARAQTQATGFLAKATSKVGGLLGKIHKHHVTQVVENLCEFKQNSEDESYLYLDPRVRGEVDVQAASHARPPVREVIAFVIGGGCYAEYQNLQMIATERRSVTYGCTELVDPGVFLRQLGELA